MGFKQIVSRMERKGVTIEQLSEKSGIAVDELNKILYGMPENYNPEKLDEIDFILNRRLDVLQSERDRKMAEEISKLEINDVESAKRFLSKIHINNMFEDMENMSDEELIQYAIDAKDVFEQIFIKKKKL